MKWQLAFLSLGFGASLFTNQPVLAALESITITSQEEWPAPRWAYGVEKVPAKSTDPLSQMARVKQAQFEGDYAGCVTKARAARGQAKSLQAWLAVTEIECAAKLKPSMANASTLSKSLYDADAHEDWFFVGPQASRLRQATASGYFALIDQDLKNNRARAWKSVERLQKLSPYFDDKTNASLWREAGEIAFILQKNEAARDYMKRSLLIADDAETRSRLATIEASLLPAGSGAAKRPVPATEKAAPATVEASQVETELVDRVTLALKSGDFIAAMDDAVKLITDFPGGTRAKWASDRVSETLVSVDRQDPKYQDVREQVLSRVEKADADRLVSWATQAYNRAAFSDALRLSKKSLSTIDGARRTRALELVADSAIATEQWTDAEKAFVELIEKSAGQPAQREALLRSGLLNFRRAKYIDAVTDFERLLALPQAENNELTAQYWLWRSLQKLKSDRAPKVADELMTKFPFSYYGLRARAESGKGALEWDNSKSKVKVESKIWVTANERLTWEKVQMLLKAGWLEEAQAELRELPPALRAEDKAVRSLVWAAAGGYVTASRLANDGWDENAEFRRAPFTSASFPKEFTDFITTQASTRNLDSDLVRSLIKQESSYNVKATSTSNAYGLMQMIPPTAREIAQDLKIGALKLPDDMFVPERNIRMGTYYLSRMVLKYQGNVPLALAAYNAGPGRIDKWIRSRPTLKNLASLKSSKPEDELWIDELPYSEPCFYVKAILRNLMLYRLLDKGRVELSEPIWSFNQVKEGPKN